MRRTKTQAKYLETSNACPACGSKNLDYEASIHEGSHHQQMVTCTCNFRWWDIYTITCYEPAETDANGDPQECSEDENWASNGVADA